jgi:hypothetical protein
MNLFSFLLPLMGTFQLEVQNNLSKAYKETKEPKLRKKRKRCVICTHFFVYTLTFGVRPIHVRWVLHAWVAHQI